MCRINVKNIQDGKNMIYKNVINYIAKEDHCINGYVGAANICLPNKKKHLVSGINAQIEDARAFYGKENNRLGIHLTVAFSTDEVAFLDHKKILDIGYYLSNYEFNNCMTYFSVHDNTDLLHLHMLIIPINLNTGTMYGCNKAGWYAVEMRLRQYLLKYIPEEVLEKEKEQVSYGTYN